MDSIYSKYMYTCIDGWIYHATFLWMADVNECQTGFNNDCSEVATCINTPGSHDCVCSNGYIMIDIDCFGKWSF